MPARHRDNIAFTVVVWVLVALGAAAVLVVLALSGAAGTLVLATALAAVPVGPVVATYLWLDRYEPEPRGLLVAALLWGACVATSAAIVLGGVGGLVAPLDRAASAVLVAPVTEEATKGLFLVLLLWWRRHELDGVLDGIVYAGMVGVGFAFTENILYLAAAYDGADGLGPGGVEAVTVTFVLRCLLSPFAHPFFTAFLGIGVGLAVTSRSRVVRLGAPVVGYGVAVGWHALWNASTMLPTGFFGTYGLLMLPAFLLLVAVAVWCRALERRVLTAALEDAAQRGLLPAADIPWIADLRLRRQVRADARRGGGARAAGIVREYQEAAVELGFLHHRVLRGTAPHDFVQRGQVHLRRMRATRPLIPIPAQVVTVR
ncbi:RsiW-degrading membrane proteinase PrsW (M82 family) [Nocardioides zeae]|uniref:RsiW-degrading membrane proteinase PrsW (M82 family) n=1 Tax=Nocardioides zeae TaxID=1457234 RepID=A0ACC6IMG1_9ACTN|nr:PrsW family intramembrane metalloprotease [Nocardioides zeae]MDR6173278.1 RsiW-degrading membrane proteinase PrsW (M82 family) [Nocardioides zeae]MDR6211825.1 RsiW-degrading membrane proteinase PrsW (M82 family) [Nocardioides zeae]